MESSQLIAFDLSSAPDPVSAENSYAEDSSRQGTMEKAFLVALAVAGVLGFLIYREGYLYLALVVAGMPFLVGSLIEPRVGAYGYCFWQAWDSAIVFGDVKQGGWLTAGKMLAFWVLAVAAIHLGRRPLRFTVSKGTLLWACLLMFVCLASSLWSYDVLLSLRIGSQMLVQLLLMVVIAGMVQEQKECIKRLAFWTIVGGTSAAAYVVLFGDQQHSYLRATLSDQANPVSAAAALVVALGCVPVLWALSSGRLAKVLLLAAVFLMLAAVVGTGTRAALGGFLGGLAGAAVLTRGRGRGKRLITMAVVLAIGYGMGAIAVYSNVVPEQAAVRLAEFMHLPSPNPSSRWTATSSGTRDYVWGLAMSGYQKSGIMGAGIGCNALATGSTGGEFRDVHSNVLGALVETGPFGLIAFFGLHVTLGLRAFKLRNPRLQVSAWIILLSFFTVGVAHTTYSTKFFWLPITFLVLLYEFDALQAEEQERQAETQWLEGP